MDSQPSRLVLIAGAVAVVLTWLLASMGCSGRNCVAGGLGFAAITIGLCLLVVNIGGGGPPTRSP